MVSRETILGVLATINDPEMPISIVDLGMVERIGVEPAEAESGGHTAHVVIDLLPTFVGCPALPVLEEEVCRKLGRLEGVGSVKVNFVFAPPWSVDRISAAGRQSLAFVGVTVPGLTQSSDSAAAASVACPFCGSASTDLESSFGPTRCRMIYYCRECKNSFEHMKRV